MEKVNLSYSTKNIPIPSRKQYKISLINKTKVFLRNLRWRAHFFLHSPKKENNKNNFGFKSDKSAPQVPQLKEFEDELISVIQNIKFKKYSKNSNDNFQQQLSKDVKNIKENSKLIVKGYQT